MKINNSPYRTSMPPYRRYHPYHYVRGGGRYRLPANFLPKGTFARWGRAGGRYLGSRVPIAPAIFADFGGKLGSRAGQYAAKLAGTGSYSLAKSRRTKRPRRYYKRASFATGIRFGGTAFRVKHRELIACINATQGFSSLLLPLNPGLDTTFPWLATIAKNFKQYKWNGLVFEYKSTSSDAIASTTDLGLGQVGWATEYDASKGAYEGLVEALNTEHANMGKPSANVLHAVECKGIDTPLKTKYIRTGPIQGSMDPKFFDLGITQFVTEMPASYSGMGQLWVTYDVTFLKPVLIAQRGLAVNSDRFRLFSVGDTDMLGDTSYEAHPLNNLGCSLDLVNERILFPPLLSQGYFKITHNARGGTATLGIGTLVTNNCSVLNYFEKNNVDIFHGSDGASATRSLIQFVVKLSGDDAWVEFGTGWNMPAAVVAADLSVQQVNGDVVDPQTTWTSITP